ncbi:zinc finger E-box-binding homeobox 2 isoform X2 [Kryptolebias marmoratus]|uniref:zinc finger E-box-binding homeobox 2 isoform X2 n=1 Tax=Kryptolebias marmoratus TaxID=37003 RepID=UPI0018ACE737|nr:zinc finger E-box-binding homeobox 2 isoform X2 [Kryptolebias marmoratus]
MQLKVDAEVVSLLGSEEEDEVGLWSFEPQDCQESLDKTSLTPSEATEEPGSPAHSTRPHSLSPGSRTCWGPVGSEAKAEEDATYLSTDRDGEQEPLRMYCKKSDSQNALEDLAHYKFVDTLRKNSPSVHLLDHLNHNGTSAVYGPSSRHDELPAAIWSPGAQHCSPEDADAVRSQQQACPFCHRMYERGASLRDHVRYCQEREGGPLLCPLCGYTAPLRSQMERHLALHNQMQDKSGITLDPGMEARKFKCLECGKAFKYKHHLKEHLRIHSGEKPYECSNCKKRFSHSGSYSSHLSSKKCLNGGGHVGGGMGSAGGVFNGHGQNSFHHLFPTSPSAGGGRSSNDKGAVFPSQSQDLIRSFGQIPADSHQLSMQDVNQNTTSFPSTSDLAKLWDCSPELSLKASILKGTALMPYLHPGTKIEQMLQEMLHRDGKMNEEMDRAGVEERREVNNEGIAERKVSPDRRRETVRSSEADQDLLKLTCRWCSQLFPNVAVLLQHKYSLCKVNREAVEVSEGFRRKDPSSPPLFYSRSALQPENTKLSEVTNGFSPLPKLSWHSAPQQLLVAMQSPSPHQDALHSRMYLSSQEKGSPSQLMHHSPEMPSPRGRRRVSSSGLSSPARLNVSNCSPEISLQQKEPGSPWSAQNEPLDLSMPKQLSKQTERSKVPNGISGRENKRDLRIQQLGRPSPTSHLPLHQYPVFSGTGAPVFPGSVYNGFPIFSQSGIGLSVHDGMLPASFSQTAKSPGFLPPVAYMMDTDAEAMLKKIYQERQNLMGEALKRSALDYLSFADDGFESEGGPGRKRLKKTDEGLYACDICEKTFQKSSSLLRHKYEHTGKRPHECKICNKAFKHKHHLIEHSRLHSGEKPYQCDKCGKRFSHSGSYSQHMNHRYAYCSKDQDLDQDQEEMPLTPLVGSLAEDKPLSVEDAQTAHSFLSDSSLDGALDALKEGEEEEERVGKTHRSLLEAADELGSSFIQESPTGEEQNERNDCEVGSRIKTESHIWDRDAEDQNEDLNKCELNLDITGLPRIKT